MPASCAGGDTPWLKGVGFGVGVGDFRVDFGYKADEIPSSLQVTAAFRPDVLIARMKLAVVVSAVLLAAAPAAALDVQIKDVRGPASVVTTTIELRDLLPDRFKKTLDEGGVLHLRVQAELWESRPVWDRLVYPAIVRVFRFRRAAERGAVGHRSDRRGDDLCRPRRDRCRSRSISATPSA